MQTADLILIPLLDGTFSLAQVDQIADGTVRLFLSTQTAKPHTPPKQLWPDDVIAVITLDTDTINWAVIGYETVPRIPVSPVNAQPQDPAIAEALANAINGLYPWDGFPDPTFFNSFLRDPATRPVRARFAADFPTPDT